MGAGDEDHLYVVPATNLMFTSEPSVFTHTHRQRRKPALAVASRRRKHALLLYGHTHYASFAVDSISTRCRLVCSIKREGRYKGPRVLVNTSHTRVNKTSSFYPCIQLRLQRQTSLPHAPEFILPRFAILRRGFLATDSTSTEVFPRRV